MEQRALFLVVFLCVFSLYGQNAISGYINQEDLATWEQKIHLTKIDEKETPVATAQINKDGFFSFHKKHISDKNTMYRLYVNRVEKIINDTIVNNRLFITSNVDSVRFEKGVGLFTGYRNSNLADAEWRRLKKFESRLKKNSKGRNEIDSSAYVMQMKSYTKDSLEILMVKLIGIKQLENKNLLEKDIAKNPKYYVALLEELKASELDRSTYRFLERKLAYLTQDVVEEKYKSNKIINVILGIIIVGLVFFVIRLKRKGNRIPVDLSKQEKNVHTLILEGKSNKEIANELFISLSTVKTHITNIYSKLKVSSRQELLQEVRN